MIWVIILLAVILRLIFINQSLWLDEAINIFYAKNSDFLTFITRYPVGDFHPPLYFALLWIWGYLFGFGEVTARIPSVILGVVTVWLTYLCGRELFNKRVGILASALLAFGPLHIYYSQEARMYSLATFATALSFYFLIKALKTKGKFWIAYFFSIVLLTFSDYLVYLVIPAQALYVFLFERKWLKQVLISYIAALIFLIPWLPIFKLQLMTGNSAASSLPGWAQVVGKAQLKELGLVFLKSIIGKISIYDKTFYAIIAIFLSLPYGLLLINSLKKIEKQTKLLLFWIILPLGLSFVISFFIPILSYFRMIFILPAFYILIAKGLDLLPKRFFATAFGGLILVSTISLVIFYTNPFFQRENWKGAVNKIDNLAKNNGVILFEDNNLPAPFLYYSQNQAPAVGGLVKVPAKDKSDIVDLSFNKKDVYVFEYLIDINDPRRILFKELENFGFKRIQTFDFEGVGFVHLYKKAGTI